MQDLVSGQKNWLRTNAKTKSQRVAEGDAILASIFGEVAVAA